MKAATIMCSLVLAACGAESAPQAKTRAGDVGGPLVVAAVNYPLAYFAERIAGTVADVRLPVPAKVDPAYWSPTPDDVLAMQAADLIVLNTCSVREKAVMTAPPPSRGRRRPAPRSSQTDRRTRRPATREP